MMVPFPDLDKRASTQSGFSTVDSGVSLRTPCPGGTDVAGIRGGDDMDVDVAEVNLMMKNTVRA